MNFKYKIFLLTILFPLFALNVYSQGESSLQFLLISPSSEAAGMGESSVGVATTDPLSIIRNPAHLGIFSLNRYFNTAYYSRSLQGIYGNEFNYIAAGISGGLNFKKSLGWDREIAVGIGYTRIFYDYRGTYRTLSSGPENLGDTESYESSDNLTLSIGVDNWVKSSMGFTFKHINSHLTELGTEEEIGTGTSTLFAFDYGFFIEAPVIKIFSNLSNKSLELFPNIKPIFNFSLGFSFNNIGDKVSYIDKNQGDPLPRTTRVGIGINLGLLVAKKEVEWQPVSIKFTREISDLLISRGQEWKYQSLFGDINFLNGVILGKTNDLTEKRTGLEFNLLEIAYIRFGKLDDHLGGRIVNARGYTFSIAGCFKLLQVLDYDISSSSQVVNFLFDKVDFRLNYSSWNTNDAFSPLNDSRFLGIGLFIYN
ncbi:MAG: hypothetical protein QME58_13975 [Bacteroidota bacterium]|nr:hypothetical protein [Bacteroidota bacterium]